MQTIKFENLLNELKNLKKDEQIFVDVSEDIMERIKLTKLRQKAYENLFESYINNSNEEEALKFNLDKFLDKYTEFFIQTDDMIREEIIKSIGVAAFEYLTKVPNFNYQFDYILNKLIIYKSL